ncbi:MAG: type II toxin-antitoxin system HicB family antitoxin [Lachnospiraceae bacterium]|nr:type II toxin-antitoxin system HicB family antitoxin [Lachnospiraceae bacterium]
MGNYYFPAVFTEEGEGYNVRFPDLEGCFTCGDDLKDALNMAADVLACCLCDMEIEDQPIPAPSDGQKLKIEKGEFINYITCDTDAYRRQYKKISVKKTLTIPQWLNEAAIVRNINFSQVLQEALIELVNK